MSLAVNHLIGFGARRAGSVARSLGSQISPSGLTKFGNLTGNGGLTAAFDGTTSQAGASGAAGTGSSNPGYVGMTLTSAKRVYHVVTYGSNNAGYSSAGTNITLRLFAKAGAAPANATDGTQLATTGSFTDGSSTDSRTLVSSDQETLFDHLWVVVDDATSDQRFAEAQFFEAV